MSRRIPRLSVPCVCSPTSHCAALNGLTVEGHARAVNATAVGNEGRHAQCKKLTRNGSSSAGSRADIHYGPEHERLQSKAGYIDARPHIRQLDESSLATHGRTIHVGQTRRIDTLTMCPPCPLHIR